MSWKEYLVVGLKLIGLYCLLHGVEDVFRVFPQQFETFKEWGQLHGVFRLSALMTMAIPLIMAGLGLYLIRDGSLFYDRAAIDDDIDESRGWVALGIVLFGFYLWASAVPDILSIVPDAAIVLQAPSYVGTDDSIARLKSAASLASITVLLGIVCVLRGQDIAGSAFKRGDFTERDFQ